MASATLVAALLAGGCATEPSAITGRNSSYGYSWQQELQLGAETDHEIVGEMGTYADPSLESYVESVANRVLAQSDFRDADAPELYRNTQFTFRVIDSPVVNAFALPGGYVYVTRGLLAHLNNEAQLAVVLGHEIAHVTARHSSRQALRSQLSQIGLVAGAVIGQQVFSDVPDLGSTILDLGGSALQLIMFRYSRDAERESDGLGVRYASAAGYDATESAAFFRSLQRLSAESGKSLPAWASTHPDPGERAETVTRLGAAARSPGQSAEVGAERLLEHIDGIVLGDDPRQGFRRGGSFYHPELQFQFPLPAGWALQNERDKVVLGEPGNGALITLELTRAADASAAAYAFLKQSGAQSTGVENTSINGLRASRVVGRVSNGGKTIGFAIVFIEYGGRVFRFAGLASESMLPRWLPLFDRTFRGFTALTNRAILDVEPVRLRVVTNEREAPFRDLVPTSLPAGLTAEQLAILNQTNLDEPLPVGRSLKLPR